MTTLESGGLPDLLKNKLKKLKAQKKLKRKNIKEMRSGCQKFHLSKDFY